MNSEPKTFPPTALIDAEERLGETKFLGIPVGSTLGSSFSSLHVGVGDWSHGTWARSIASHWMRYFSPKSKGRQVALPKAKVLMTLASNHPRYREIVLPVLEQFDAAESLLLCQSPAQIQSKYRQIQWADACQFDGSFWRSKYDSVRTSWAAQLRDVCKSHKFPKRAFAVLKSRMMFSSQAILGCRRILEEVRPSLVLTDYDRHPTWSCLVLVAKQMKIPTATLVHGVFNLRAYGYIPLLADSIFCWGDNQRQALIDESIDAERIYVTGCPRHSRELSITREQAKANLGIDPESKLVLFATNFPNPIQHSCELLRCFADATNELDVVAAVRLHPTENKQLYEDLLPSIPKVSFLDSDISLECSLAAADVVVVSNSGVGSDALLKKRPVIVLNLDRHRVGYGEYLSKEAGCPLTTGAHELANSIGASLSPSGQEQLTASAEDYVHRFCAFYEKDSARKIASTIKSRLTEYAGEEAFPDEMTRSKQP